LAIAASGVGHEIVGVVSKDGIDDRYGPAISWDGPLPDADIALIAVRDSQIQDAAFQLSGSGVAYPVVAHLSGFNPVTDLAVLVPTGASIGGFHPLQTLPHPVKGAAALAGSYVAITGEDLAYDMLMHLGDSLGMSPFALTDEGRPGYHAAAAAAANFIVTCLATSADLMESVGIDPAVVRPLVEQVVANVFDGDPDQALTGPIARGDLETVIGHLTAAHQVSPEVGEQFRLIAEATAIRAGRPEQRNQWI
jgi:predicted short-subunit dehydrogenase-like oxidoreductase (DUF2520 family)